MIAAMRVGGLPDQVIAFACDLLPLYVMANCYEQSLYSSETTVEEIAGYTDDLRAYFASLPPERFPNVVSLAVALTSGGDRDRFEFGLEVLLRGFAAMPG
jgi:hypothetical protein